MINPNTAALAVTLMTERLLSDCQATTANEIENAVAKANQEAASTIRMLVEMQGQYAPGNPDEGNMEDAEQLVEEAMVALADPVAYANKKASSFTTPQETAQTATVTATAETPSTSRGSTEMHRLLEEPSAPVIPTMRMIKKPAALLFPDIAKGVGTMMFPCPSWEDGEPEGIPTRDEHYKFHPFHLRILNSSLTRKRPALATGDPGCGKTEFFKQLAATLRMPCTIIPVDGSLRRSDLIGSFRQIATDRGSETPFVLGLIPRAIQKPGIIVFDEIDQADPDNHYVLHQIYEGNGITLQEDGGRYLPRHPNCYVFATANTKGRGSDNGLTHTRYEMSEATRDRFPYWLEFTYLPAKDEADVITKKTGLVDRQAQKLVEIGNSIRAAYSSGAANQPCSTRQLLNAAELASDIGISNPDEALALAIDIVMAGRATAEDGAAIREFVRAKLGVDLATIER